MSSTREFTIQVEDRPGALAKACRSLADRRVNIMAFQSFPNSEGTSLVRFVADNSANAKTALDIEGLKYTEAEVAQVKLPHRAGALADVASHLAEAKINIKYAYSGLDFANGAPFLILGVPDVGKAAKIVDQAVAAVAT
jgi:hypothetical protein